MKSFVAQPDNESANVTMKMCLYEFIFAERIAAELPASGMLWRHMLCSSIYPFGLTPFQSS
ncbi:MAG TPA: hypothetical protein PKE17_19375 [Saprospiraceae bacterium]|nr:hypothetical protein [Saprospiraceae bacterium]